MRLLKSRVVFERVTKNDDVRVLLLRVNPILIKKLKRNPNLLDHSCRKFALTDRYPRANRPKSRSSISLIARKPWDLANALEIKAERSIGIRVDNFDIDARIHLGNGRFAMHVEKAVFWRW